MKITYDKFYYDFYLVYGATYENPYADTRIINLWNTLYNPEIAIHWEKYAKGYTVAEGSIDIHKYFKSKRHLLRVCSREIKKELKFLQHPVPFKYHIKKILSQNLELKSYKDSLNASEYYFNT